MRTVALGALGFASCLALLFIAGQTTCPVASGGDFAGRAAGFRVSGSALGRRHLRVQAIRRRWQLFLAVRRTVHERGWHGLVAVLARRDILQPPAHRLRSPHTDILRSHAVLPRPDLMQPVNDPVADRRLARGSARRFARARQRARETRAAHHAAAHASRASPPAKS